MRLEKKSRLVVANSVPAQSRMLPAFILEQYHEAFTFIHLHILKEISWKQLEAAILDRQDEFLTGLGIYAAVLPQLCSQLVGGDLRQSLPATAAWILSDLSSDVFDDVQDRDGKDRVWNQWQPHVAISVGLALLFAAQRCLAHIETSHRAMAEISRRWADTGMLAAHAQSFCQSNPPTIKRYFEQLIAKSGTIFSTVAWTGAYIGAGASTELAAIEEYGLNLGILIQLRDDCRDMTSQQVLGDLQQGEFTLPVLHGLQMKEHPLHSRLTSLCFSQERLSEKTSSTIIGMLDEMQAFSFTLRVADAYRARAVSALSGFDLEEARYLREYAEHVFASIVPRLASANRVCPGGEV
ncbi:MAG: polyprenyl synthetase family protein [Rhizobiaceae bacterium]